MFLRVVLALIILTVLSPLSGGESIREYHTTITVHPSGSLHIRENIRYDFGTHQKHGIFRDIPLTVKSSRFAPALPVGLEHFSVTLAGKPVPFSRTVIDSATGGKMARYRIGDPHTTLSGEQTYRLEYDVQQGVYPSALPGMDAIRWNAVGAGSQIPTHHATAELILPPVLSRDDVRIDVFTGRYGSKTTQADYQWIDDHRVRFVAENLAPHEALTVEANYPEGVLGERAASSQDSWLTRLLRSWHWGALGGFLLFVWQYAKRLGADDPVAGIAPQYYPPEGLSLLQSGLVIDKFADKEDFPAAILELGALGYLEIHQYDGSKTPFIRRIDAERSLESLTMDQRFLLEQILFKNGDVYHIKRGDSEQAERLNTQLEQLNDLLYSWSVSDGQMQTNPRKTRQTFLMRTGFIAVVLGALALYSTFRVMGADIAIMVSMAMLFIGIGGFFLFRAVRSRSYSGIFFGGIWLLISLSSFGRFFVDMPDKTLLLTAPVMLLPVMALSVGYFYRRIGRFTPKGRETYRYLLGYSAFMKRVEQERIRRFLKQDPHYLDRGLPYAILFGHNRHWIRFYDTLDVPPPLWYHGSMHHVDAFSRAVEHAMVAPASESGGFSGGGSFAGGGGGGGGVGSW